MNKISAKLNVILVILPFFTIMFCSCTDNKHSRTLEQELAELNDFILEKEANGLDIDTTDLGVYYIIKQKGEGPFPEQGDTCYIEYLCYFLDGKLHESSSDIFNDGIWKYIYMGTDIMPGLSDGIGQMNKNARVDIIIPSYLAGDVQESTIPPFTTLIYVTKMLDLRTVNN
jgi:FKBP-type peptidyl-prolyl cis-trans isomerase FkpA